MLIVISSPHLIEKEIVAISALCEQGITAFHLRKPTATESEMRELLAQIPLKYHPYLMLHQYHHLIYEFPTLKGLHFKEENKPDMFWKDNSPNLCFSQAVHELSSLNLLPNFIDYALLSPIFDSISKTNYLAQFDYETLKNYFLFEKTTHANIIALGGVDDKKAAQAKQLGFQGVAVLGYLWQPYEQDFSLDNLLQRVRALASSFI